MDLIDRYLVFVRRHLPAALQDDVVQELGDSLRSEAEDRERESGRPLTADDQAALLRKRGHPWLMASRYMPQQQLIGPALFPFYRQALKIVVFWVVLPIVLVGGAIRAIYSADASGVWGDVLGSAWSGSIFAVGMVTILFAILDHQQVRFTMLDKWDPAKLPEPKAGRVIPRSHTVAGLVVGLTILLWWVDLLKMPEFMTWADEGARLVAAPIWGQVYYLILASIIAGIVVSLIDLIRPWRTVAVSAIDIVINLFDIVVIALLLRAGHYVDVVGITASAENIAKADYWLNAIVHWSLLTVGAFVVFNVLYEVWRLARMDRG